MTLNQEILRDIASGELGDLFAPVMLDGVEVRAIIGDEPLSEAFQIGGERLESERRFKFVRGEVPGLSRKSKIGLGADTYDVTAIEQRPDRPWLSVRATLRA